MRLLNAYTLEIEHFLQREVPEYVILSHTWGKDEVTLQDMQSWFRRKVGVCENCSLLSTGP
jgi:hypothetical protein